MYNLITFDEIEVKGDNEYIYFRYTYNDTTCKYDLENDKIINNNMSEYIIIFPEEFLKENKDTILSWKECKDKDSFDFNLWKPAP